MSDAQAGLIAATVRRCSARPGVVKVVSFGQHPACDVVLHDEYASALHAVAIQMSDGRVLISDMGSTNGTRVNGVSATDWLPLRPGDVVRMGRADMPWRADD